MLKKSASTNTSSVSVWGGTFDSMYSMASVKSANVCFTGHTAWYNKLFQLKMKSILFAIPGIVCSSELPMTHESYLKPFFFKQRPLFALNFVVKPCFVDGIKSLRNSMLCIFSMRIIVITNPTIQNATKIYRSVIILNILFVLLDPIHYIRWHAFTFCLALRRKKIRNREIRILWWI